MESPKKIAAEFGVREVAASWRQIIENPDIDAVCIGTWPYMHCPITIAALENHKHVLCEARMALNAREAHKMLDISRKNKNINIRNTEITVPFPFNLVLIITSKQVNERQRKKA